MTALARTGGLRHGRGMRHETRGPIVTVFRSRLRADAAENGYGELAARMEARAPTMPGFLGFKTFTAADGERVSIIEFDTLEHHNGWRDDPEHRTAQARGRQSFYAEYSIAVCERLAYRNFDGTEPVSSTG
jgi:heme-degrading monooxygenase HmoA